MAGTVHFGDVFRISSADDTVKTFKDLPHASSVTFISTPPVDMSTLLPNLPLTLKSEPHQVTSHFPPEVSSPTPLDLIHRLLVYPPASRLNAAETLKHPWFGADSTLLPDGYGTEECTETLQVCHHWGGKTLGEWMHLHLT